MRVAAGQSEHEHEQFPQTCKGSFTHMTMDSSTYTHTNIHANTPTSTFMHHASTHETEPDT